MIPKTFQSFFAPIMTINIKGKILENAEKLFHKYGVRSVPMDDIARELPILKKTIYRFFLGARVNRLL